MKTLGHCADVTERGLSEITALDLGNQGTLGLPSGDLYVLLNYITSVGAAAMSQRWIKCQA